MPQTNKSVQFSINDRVVGTMTFQLFDNLTPNTASHIETLVNDGFYNGDYIYRAQSGFVVQGGNNPPQINSGGTTSMRCPPACRPPINEEFNPDLNYTSAGTLAMARTSSANTSGTEFFVAEAATRSLDYGYTLFGFQTVDQAITFSGKATTVLQARASRRKPPPGISYLITPVKITLGEHHHRHAERRLDAACAHGRHGQLHRDRDGLTTARTRPPRRPSRSTSWPTRPRATRPTPGPPRPRPRRPRSPSSRSPARERPRSPRRTIRRRRRSCNSSFPASPSATR